MSKFQEWLDTEAGNVKTAMEAADTSPGAVALMAERAWVLALVTAKFKELGDVVPSPEPVGSTPPGESAQPG